MAKGEDLIKYITQRVVTYMETPKEARMEHRVKQSREPWQYRWFGMLPLAIQLWLEKPGEDEKRIPPSNG